MDYGHIIVVLCSLNNTSSSLRLWLTVITVYFPSPPFPSPPFLSPPFLSPPFLSPPFLSPPFLSFLPPSLQVNYKQYCVSVLRQMILYSLEHWAVTYISGRDTHLLMSSRVHTMWAYSIMTTVATPIQRTPLGQRKVSFIERCPFYRGQFTQKMLFWGNK